MKFRMFTDTDGRKVAVNVDVVERIEENKNENCTNIFLTDIQGSVDVREDFDTVFSRLNTVAE